jgi:hypothetical protein
MLLTISAYIVSRLTNINVEPRGLATVDVELVHGASARPLSCYIVDNLIILGHIILAKSPPRLSVPVDDGLVESGCEG